MNKEKVLRVLDGVFIAASLVVGGVLIGGCVQSLRDLRRISDLERVNTEALHFIGQVISSIKVSVANGESES